MGYSLIPSGIAAFKRYSECLDQERKIEIGIDYVIRSIKTASQYITASGHKREGNRYGKDRIANEVIQQR